MAKKYRKREGWESAAYTHEVFRPYATALGQIALAWNGFHEAMSLLYCMLMGGGTINQHTAVWHALKNDRAQRDILLAAAKSMGDGMPSEQREKLIGAIQWILGQASKVEDARDDALHSPLWGYPPSKKGAPRRVLPVVPLAGLGHVRAKKLMERKSLLAEFRWCRDSAIVLEDYVKALDAWMSGRGPWPDTPSLPNRGETSAKKPRRPTPQAKRPRRPRPSRA